MGTNKKPPQPSAAEREADAKFRASVKNEKPSKADIGAIGRGNRSSGKKAGGAVKKYAAGGLTKIMPTANQMGGLGMAKGGKVAGRAMVKNSADTMGRAMVKKAGGGKCYAKGGSIDGIAQRGKTKCKKAS